METIGGGLIIIAMIIAVSRMTAAGVGTADAVNELRTGEPAEHEVPGCGGELVIAVVAVILFLAGMAAMGGLAL